MSESRSGRNGFIQCDLHTTTQLITLTIRSFIEPLHTLKLLSQTENLHKKQNNPWNGAVTPTTVCDAEMKNANMLYIDDNVSTNSYDLLMLQAIGVNINVTSFSKFVAPW